MHLVFGNAGQLTEMSKIDGNLARLGRLGRVLGQNLGRLQHPADLSQRAERLMCPFRQVEAFLVPK
jgi:hypothetical protein